MKDLPDNREMECNRKRKRDSDTLCFHNIGAGINDLQALATKELPGVSCEISPLLKRLCGNNNNELVCEEVKHGSRLIAGAFGKEIHMVGDTRTIKTQDKKVVIDSDTKSKILSYKGMLLGYVGSEVLWKIACKSIKENWGDKVPKIKLLERAYEALQKVSLAADNQGIDIVLGYHHDAKPQMLLLVLNPPRVGKRVEEEDKERPNGVKEIDVTINGSRGKFIALGSGYASTDRHLEIKCKKEQNFEELSWTLSSGILFSSFKMECIGGHVEAFRMSPQAIISIERTSILELYLSKLPLSGEDRVILAIRTYDVKDTLTSREIFEHVTGEEGDRCHLLGALVRGKDKAFLVNRVVFPNPKQARLRLAKIVSYLTMNSLFDDLKCVKIGSRCVYLSFPTVQLRETLLKVCTFVPASEIKSN